MNVPGMGLVRRLEKEVNDVRVPLTRGRLGFASLMKRTFEDVGNDHVSAFAGSLTYSIVFALVPFLTFLVSMFALFADVSFVNNQILPQLRPALPEQAYGFVSTLLQGLASGADTEFGLSALISILVSLYGVSGAFRAIMEALNVMYDVEEDRPIWKRYLISLGLAFSVFLLLVSAVVLLVAGPAIIGTIAEWAGLGDVFATVSTILRWPILIFFVLLAFALVYHYAPDVQQSFKFLTPGSLIALLLWLLFTGAFSIYARSADFTKWGAVAGVIVLMLYIYWSSFILLLGAEMNQIIEAHAPEGKDPGEKVSPEQQTQGAAS